MSTPGTCVTGREGRLVLLHPAVLFTGVWAIALLAWALAPENVLAASISGERAGSAHAYLFFAACLGAFVVGSVAGGMAFGAASPAALTSASYRGFPLVARACAALVLIGGGVWFVRILMIVGSPAALLNLLLSGHSVIALKTAVFNPAQLAPVTTMVHLAPAAASMLILQRRVDGWTRTDRWLMAGLVVLTLLRTFVLAERFAGLGLAAAVAVTVILTSDSLRPRRVITTTIVGAFILWFAWSGGEFTRSYMDKTRGDSSHFTVANFRESLSYSQDRLGAYLFTAINNGMIIVDESPGQSFPANFAPFLARSGLPGVGGQPGAGELYRSELSREFTGESMPGRFYLDARDLGVILALAYGVILGLAWRAAALNYPAGIVLYAALTHVLLDSYRSAYLFDLQGIAGFLGAGLVLLASTRLSRAVPARPVSAGRALNAGR